LIEKTVKYSEKSRKMSVGVQIWTRLEKLGYAGLAAGQRQVEILVCAQHTAAGSYKFQWQSLRKK
jgi:hypothetical protein